MNNFVKLSVLAAIVALSACKKKEESTAAPPPAVAVAAAQPPSEDVFNTGIAMETAALRPSESKCADCQWSNVLGHDAPVSLLGCIKGNAPDAHCHMKVENSLPTSKVVVTESGGVYHFVMTTENDPETGLDCPNLALHPNPQIIWGKCTVRQPNLQSDPEHDFEAKLERMGDDQGGAYRIRFRFDHPPTTTDKRPIHNGEGHAHPN